MEVGISSGNQMPNLEVLEKYKDAEWYANCLRYYSTFYNRPYNSWDETTINDTIYGLSPVEQMRLWFYYYMGRQPNLNYGHIANDGTSKQVSWIAGQKVGQLVKRMMGNINSLLADVEISTKAISKDAKNRRTQIIEDAMMEYDNSTLFENLEKQFGVSPKSKIPNKFKQSSEDIAKYAQYDYKEQGELYGQAIAEYLYVRNDGQQEFNKAFEHATVGGICGMHRYVDNGFVKFEYIQSMRCIWDNRKESDFNKGARFGGYIDWLTPQEIEHRYKNGKVKNGLSSSEIEEIRKMAKDGDNGWVAQYETNANFSWYPSVVGNKIGEVAVVTMYWLCLRDTRYKKTKDEFGKDVVRKLNDEKKKEERTAGDYFMMDICKATMIGNRFVVDYGYCENIARDPFNQSDPILPIRFFIPDMVLDQFRSVVARLAEIQDQLDVLHVKIMESVGRDAGKGYIINGNKLGVVRAKDLLTDLKGVGVHVTTGTDGEVDSLAATQRTVEEIDMTLDPNVQMYIKLCDYFESQMEAIAAIPKVALGQEQQVGLGVQNAMLANASQSNAGFYDKFMHFVELFMRDITNVQKNIFCIEGNEDAEMVIGARGLAYLKETKEFPLEVLGVYISLKDRITPERRKELWDLAFNLSQNGLIDMKDAIKLQSETSLLKLENYFDYSIDKKEKQRQAQIQQQQAAQQQLQQQKNSGELAKTAMQEDGANDRNVKDNQTKAFVEATKAEVGNNKTQSQQTA